ncbi:peptide transporter [Thermococcus chitonophagus]|uniref:dolichyl-phosphooligosaccharide-protein glycotransferase n=1 Tax=Thermococcus chitonophagus TaxID=54262 RepID=A0A160VQN1_9EURY|nr:peptide transporter [Thermococcus chitonophagus]ASJ15912.1 peptide transporter [Thermococcus chitonophagus]CUX77155.1 oligosaccharyl transferase [Thermococcus chitonophagus]
MVKVKEKEEEKQKTSKLIAKYPTLKAGITLILTLIFAWYGFHIRHLTAGKYFPDPDTFYHFEIYKLVLKEGLPKYYPLSDAPFGSLIAEPLGLYLLPATFYKIISVFGYNEFQAFLLWPPFVGFLSILGVYLLGRKLVNDWTGLWAAAILAVSTANFSRTFSGNARGDGPFMMIFTFSLVALLYYLYETSTRKKIVWGVLFVGLASLSTAAWNGSPFGLMVLIGFASLQTIALFIFGKIEEVKKFVKEFYPAYLAILIVAYLLTIPGISRIQGFVRFAFEVYLGLIFLAVVMLYGGKYLNYSDKKHRFAVVAIIVLIGFAGAYAYVGPKLFRLMGGAYQSTQVYQTVQELAKTRMSDVKAYYGVEKGNGLIFFLSIPGFLAMAIAYIVGLWKRGESQHKELLGIIFYIMSLYLMSLAVRFLFLASYAIAIFAGASIGYALEIVEKMKENIGIKAAFAIVVSIMVLLIPLTNGPVLARSAKAISKTEVETTGWEQVLKWLRDNTPKYSTATSWWDYGYWIESSLLGNRRASADGGHARDRDHILALFLARDGNISEVDFESWELNYFLIYLNDWVKFNAISYLGGAITRKEYQGDEEGRGQVSTIIPVPKFGEAYINPYMRISIQILNTSVRVRIGSAECSPMLTVFIPGNQKLKGTGACDNGGSFPYIVYILPNMAIMTYYKVATSNFLKLAYGIPASKEPEFTEKLFSNFRPVYQYGNVIVYKFTPFAIYKIQELVNGTWKTITSLTPGTHTLKLYISAFGRDIRNATLYVEAVNGTNVKRIEIGRIEYMNHLHETPIVVNVTLPQAEKYRFILVQKGPVGVLTGPPKVNGEIANPIRILNEGQSGKLELKVGVHKDYKADLYLRVTFIYLVREGGKSNDDYNAAFEPHMDVFFATKVKSGVELHKGDDNIIIANAKMPEGIISNYKDELKKKYGDKLIIRGIRVEPVFIAEKQYILGEVRASAPHHSSE